MSSDLLTEARLDRVAHLRRDEAWLAERRADPASRFVVLWRSQALIRLHGEHALALRLAPAQLDGLRAVAAPPIFLGLAGGQAQFAVDLAAVDDPAPLPAAIPGLDPATDSFIELRAAGPLLGEADAAALVYGRGLAHWHHTHGFCGRCGHPTDSRQGGHTRLCRNPACATEHFPRTDPAIIVLVAAGDRCLLGRQSRWRPGMYSTLAGFVEPGETIEETVHREVMEETGVALARVTYHSSQPWPFPGSLMLGFTAEAAAATPPVVDPHELEDAGWFTRRDIERFPEQGRSLPDTFTIARRLIDGWRFGRR